MTDEINTSTIHCVGHGIDTFYLNVSYAKQGAIDQKGPMILDADLAHQLEDLKSQAQEQEKEIETPWTFERAPLMMQPYGAGKGQWSWVLTSPLVNLTVSSGRLNGIIAQVRLASRFLWSQEWCGDALSKVHQFLRGVFGEHIYLQVSEVHLCADIVGWNPNLIDWQERFVSRSVGDDGRPFSLDGLIDGPDVVDRRWKKINALTFGRHTSRLSCVIYNKRLEIETKSKKTWFYDLWRKPTDEHGKPLWDGASDVWRVEVRYKREFLHAIGIEWAYDLLDKMRDIWSYAVGHVHGGDDGYPDGWLRLTLPGPDTNRTRWEVDPAWKVIQAAFDDIEVHQLGELVFKQEKERNVERLVQQAAGCISSLAAIGADLYPILGASLPDTMEWLTHAIDAYYKFKDISFYRAVTEKRIKLVRLNT